MDDEYFQREKNMHAQSPFYESGQENDTSNKLVDDHFPPPPFDSTYGYPASSYLRNGASPLQSYGYPAQSYSIYPVVSPCDLMMVVRQVVKRGLNDLDRKEERLRLSETAMIAYLMGAGFDFRYAEKLIESWDVGEMPSVREIER